MQTQDKKNKTVSFRIAFADYLRIAELANAREISITDFLLSLVYPALQGKTPVMHPDVTPAVTANLVADKKGLQSDAISLDSLVQEGKKLNQKLKQLNN